MDVAGGRSAGFGRIGGELRASAYTPLSCRARPPPPHSLPVVRRSSLRSWTRLGIVVAVVIALAVVATLAIKARFAFRRCPSARPRRPTRKRNSRKPPPAPARAADRAAGSRVTPRA